MKRHGTARRALARAALCARILITVAAVVLCTVGIYIHILYPAEKLDELWFYLTGSSGAGTAAVWQAFAALIGPCLAAVALLLLPQYAFSRHPLERERVSRRTGKVRRVRLLPLRHKWLFTIVSALILVGIGLGQVGAFRYLRSRFTESEFFESEYNESPGPLRLGLLWFGYKLQNIGNAALQQLAQLIQGVRRYVFSVLHRVIVGLRKSHFEQPV